MRVHHNCVETARCRDHVNHCVIGHILARLVEFLHQSRVSVPNELLTLSVLVGSFVLRLFKVLDFHMLTCGHLVRKNILGLALGPLVMTFTRLCHEPRIRRLSGFKKCVLALLLFHAELGQPKSTLTPSTLRVSALHYVGNHSALFQGGR